MLFFVTFWVPADHQGSNSGVHEEIRPPAYPCLVASQGSRTTRRTTQRTRGLYWFRPPLWCNTLLQCVVWWIASWADDDEQYKEEQPREGLFLAGAMNCWEEFSHPSLSLSIVLSLPSCGWLVLFIEALVLFPNIEREGSQQWRANLKGDN